MTSDHPPEGAHEPEAGHAPEAAVRGGPGNMLPPRRGRRFALERVFVRLVATTGIIGIGVGLGAVLADNKVQGWIIGLVVALVSVILAGVLWSSRQL
jgi:hypothetical protein